MMRLCVLIVALFVTLTTAGSAAPSSTMRITGDPSDFEAWGLNGIPINVGSQGIGDLVAGDFGSTVPAGCDGSRRIILRFPLSSLAGVPPAAAQLTVTIEETRRDQFPPPGIIDQFPPFTNPGLGDLVVAHVADQPVPTPTAWSTPSVGNDPGTIVPAALEPLAAISVDVTAAMQQSVLAGDAFLDLRLQTAIDTDFDCRNDAWFIYAAEATNPDVRPYIDYVPGVVDRTPPVFSGVPAPVIDATRPDGAVVGYSAPVATDAVDGVVPVFCSPPPGSLFPVGDTLVACSAADKAGNTARVSFTVHVRGAVEQLERLRATLETYMLDELGNSLSAEIRNAYTLLTTGRPVPASRMLGAFIAEVTAQGDRHLTADQASTLADAAARIQDVI